MTPAWIVPAWPAPPAVRAASTLRTGGISPPPWDSLNLGDHVGDAPERVAENRRASGVRSACPGNPRGSPRCMAETFSAWRGRRSPPTGPRTAR
jgi:hypothetical protein